MAERLTEHVVIDDLGCMRWIEEGQPVPMGDYDLVCELAQSLQAERARNARYREALEHYAAKDNWGYNLFLYLASQPGYSLADEALAEEAQNG